MSKSISAEFFAKMRRLLSDDEFAAFVASFEQPSRVGLRVNELKLSPADFSSIAPFALSAVGAHEPAGFVVQDDAARPGRHPYHAAGLYYLQEPAAMTVGGLVDAQPGELVLDLAAAPGGKATHLATSLNGDGLLVANDVHRGRAKILAENLERWGVRNVLILNDEPERLADHFGPIFDKVLLDAPCSGEGMFRRTGGFEWSEAMVAACARRQRGILPVAARLVRPGGQLVYATCTFSPEENEAVVGRFLVEQPEFVLIESPRSAGLGHGRPEWAGAAIPEAVRLSLSKTVRLWPHQFAGEGHFVAVLKRAAGELAAWPIGDWKRGRRENLGVWWAFAAETLGESWQKGALDEERLVVGNGRLYLLPKTGLATKGLKLVRHGLLLGEMRRSHFKPAHTLAMALHRQEALRSVLWAADDARVAQFLAGHDVVDVGEKGWLLVCVAGFPLGWGKRVGGRIKNHYPRGLRINRA